MNKSKFKTEWIWTQQRYFPLNLVFKPIVFLVLEFLIIVRQLPFLNWSWPMTQIGEEEFNFGFESWVPGLGEVRYYQPVRQVPWSGSIRWGRELIRLWLQPSQVISWKIRHCAAHDRRSSRGCVVSFTLDIRKFWLILPVKTTIRLPFTLIGMIRTCIWKLKMAGKFLWSSYSTKQPRDPQGKARLLKSMLFNCKYRFFSPFCIFGRIKKKKSGFNRVFFLPNQSVRVLLVNVICRIALSLACYSGNIDICSSFWYFCFGMILCRWPSHFLKRYRCY